MEKQYSQCHQTKKIPIRDKVNKTYKFRPQILDNAFKIKHCYKTAVYNWRPRFSWTLKTYLHHVFSVLHYRSSHAPKPIQKKWRKFTIKFENFHKKI
jgi:hypothetical protein